MDDLISRQAAIDALADYIHNVDKVMGTGHLTADDCKDAATSVFEELPSAQPERKKGRWIYRPEIGWGDAWVCSECKEITKSTIMGKPRYNFCPMCGADMRGDNDE